MRYRHIKNKTIVKYIAFTSLVFFSELCLARKWSFDPLLLGGGGVDISVLENGGQIPGFYEVDVILNGVEIDTKGFKFELKRLDSGDQTLLPCLTEEDFIRYGIKYEDYPNVFIKDECANISAIPQASVEFLFNDQSIILSIPQIALIPKERGIAPQQLWDDGISAAFMNYNYNYNHVNNNAYESTYSSKSEYLQLNPGINIGGWRLRNQTNWKSGTDNEKSWDSVYNYAEKGIYSLKSKAIIGESNTTGDIFDTIPYKGISIEKDDKMIPYNQRSYSPMITGVAKTNARIEVKQNGYTIYNTMVSPGEFNLSDISISSYGGGELDVTVWESDGSTQYFRIPSQIPVIALREGFFDYSAMAGKYRSYYIENNEPYIGQLTVSYGFPLNVTAYMGFQVCEACYYSATIGMGTGLGDFGALSLDTTYAKYEYLNSERKGSGATWRLRYNKHFGYTNTSLVSSLQFYSSNYKRLNDVVDESYFVNDLNELNDNGRLNARYQTSISQSLNSGSSLNLSAYRDVFNNTYSDYISIGYGFNIAKATASIFLSKNTNEEGGDEKLNIMLSLPLNKWVGGNSRVAYSSSNEGSRVGLNGNTFDKSLYWGVSQYIDNSNSSESSSAVNLQRYGTYGNINSYYSYSKFSKQLGGGVSGGMLLHKDGVTLSQPLNNTSVLVKAPGATSVPVGNMPGIKTDYRGYTVMSYMNPYQENIISLDPLYLPENADVSQTDLKVVPTEGAIVRATFKTNIGGRAFLVINRPDGSKIPFGSIVTVNDKEQMAGIVDEEGRVYISGLSDFNTIKVKWGPKSFCTGDVDYINNTLESKIPKINVICR